MFRVVLGILLLVIYVCKRQQINNHGRGRERDDFTAIDYSLLCGFCSERFPLPPLSGLRLAALFYCDTPWAFHIFISKGFSI